jgi:peptide/nickel transport system substrate-binding protein
MKHKKIIVISHLFILFALLFSACTSSDAPDVTEGPDDEGSETLEAPTEEDTDEPPVDPVVLRVGGLEDIDCWNPFACPLNWDYNEFVYEGVNSRGSDLSCKGDPRLAETIERSEDGLTWTVKLFEGITFSDGTPLNAQGVVDFFTWWNSTDLKGWYNETNYMTSLEALDEYTFQFTTEIPITTYPDLNGRWLWVMAPHIWGEQDNSTLFTFENFPPIGTGPYTVADWSPGEYIIYDAREEYHLGKPPIDRIVYQIYSNWDALIQAFIAGEIDATAITVPPEYYQALDETENATVLEIPPGRMHYLVFNMYPGGNQHPAVNDPAFREALDYAINRQQIVDVELLGHGVTCTNNWACGPAYEGKLNPNFEVTPYDPAHAIQILEDAGYVDSDGDGIREAPNGEPLKLRLFYALEVPTHITLTESLKGWFAEIGIETEVAALEVGTLFSVVLNERDFDIALYFQGAEWHPASVDFYYSCWSADAGMFAWNMPGYCNPDFDEAIFQGISTLNPEEQMQAFFQAQEYLYNDRPLLILVGQNQIQAYNNAKFELSHDFCVFSLGAWHYPAIMEAIVK